MTKGWTEHFAYVTGTVRYSDLVYCALAGEQPAASDWGHTYFVEWDRGEWLGCKNAEWALAGMCVALTPLHQMCAIGTTGGARFMGSKDLHDEQIGGSAEVITSRGPLQGVRTIGERVYVVGLGRQAWRRDGLDTWVSIDKGLTRPKPGEVAGYQSVDGFAEDDIYAVGWDGEIVWYDGDSWHQRKSPTDLVLTRVLCAGNGVVYASGRRGLLLQGRGDEWEVVKHEGILEDIWDLAWYRDTLYLSTMYGVYTLRDGKLFHVDFGDHEPQSFYGLSAGDGVLWSIGPKDVMAFDGETWTRIDGPQAAAEE